MIDEEGSLIVTGGASGIGLATVLEASRRGRRVAILDLGQDRVDSAAEKALAAGARAAVGLACDVRSSSDVVSAVDSAAEGLGAISSLVCSAGLDAGGRLHEVSEDHWALVIDTNLGGVYRACREVLRHFLATPLPNMSIVCVSSAAARFAIPGASSYSATKAGICALVRNIAIDYCADGIRANAVLPGSTETPLMWANVPEADQQAMRDTIASEVPLGRLAEAIEPAKAILWLLSTEALYITGTDLACDGGLLAKAPVSV